MGQVDLPTKDSQLNPIHFGCILKIITLQISKIQKKNNGDSPLTIGDESNYFA